MKIRMKFGKTGPVKFVGHLDVMRYFQKAFRRADVDIAYSKGFSPHQILSFASPLGIGLTSEGEYLDAEFHSVDTTKVMLDKINSVMNEGIFLLEFKKLPDQVKNGMASVAAADYEISFRPGYYNVDAFLQQAEQFLCQDSIIMTKETKRSQKEVDILPMIYEFRASQKGGLSPEDMIEKAAMGFTMADQTLYLKVKAGSDKNLKPDLVMEAFCNFLGFDYNKKGFMFHRLDMYLSDENGELKPLGSAGEDILSPISDQQSETR
ncbi:MAG: TIGR03936 family radical SAM-associated protein [Lachnospiraceae bacterium]|nr:TIGR03936 family radical SAM-associated protein [Lachnospiraceae bacterium]